MDSDDSVFFKLLKLIAVNKITIVPASEIEMSFTERFSSRFKAERAWRKPRNGATPVPGPTIMIGVSGSSGS